MGEAGGSHPVIEQAFLITGRVKKPGVSQTGAETYEYAPEHGKEAGAEPGREEGQEGQIRPQGNLEHHQDVHHDALTLWDRGNNRVWLGFIYKQRKTDCMSSTLMVTIIRAWPYPCLL